LQDVLRRNVWSAPPPQAWARDGRRQSA